MKERSKQWIGASSALAASAVLAAARAWPFDSTPTPLPVKPSLAQLFLSDRITLGFVRLALVLLTLFVIASVPALIVAGRWIKAFGTTGLPVDDAKAEEGITSLRDQMSRLAAERDEFKASVERYIAIVRTILATIEGRSQRL